jgi:hypothetical protein
LLFFFQTSRQLSRIRRRSCGTITSHLGTTDIDGDAEVEADKNSSGEGSEYHVHVSFTSTSPSKTVDSSTTAQHGGASSNDEAESGPGQRTPSSSTTTTAAHRSGGDASSVKSKASRDGQSSNVSEVDYWSGATTNSEEDCCSCTSTEMDDDDGAAVAPGVGGAGKRRNGETGAKSGTAAFFQESLFFPFDYAAPFAPSGPVSMSSFSFFPIKDILSCQKCNNATFCDFFCYLFCSILLIGLHLGRRLTKVRSFFD